MTDKFNNSKFHELIDFVGDFFDTALVFVTLTAVATLCANLILLAVKGSDPKARATYLKYLLANIIILGVLGSIDLIYFFVLNFTA